MYIIESYRIYWYRINSYHLKIQTYNCSRCGQCSHRAVLIRKDTSNSQGQSPTPCQPCQHQGQQPASTAAEPCWRWNQRNELKDRAVVLLPTTAPFWPWKPFQKNMFVICKFHEVSSRTYSIFAQGFMFPPLFAGQKWSPMARGRFVQWLFKSQDLK